MNKIATRAYCNGTANTDAFVTPLTKCPTYEHIMFTEKFNVINNYENNQLVKQNDISKKNNLVNHGIIYGTYKISLGTNKKVFCDIYSSLLYLPKANLILNVNVEVTVSNTVNPIVKTFTCIHKTTDGNSKLILSDSTGITISGKNNVNDVKITNITIISGDTYYEYNLSSGVMSKVDDLKMKINSTSVKINDNYLSQNNETENIDLTVYVDFEHPSGVTNISNFSVEVSSNVNYGYSSIPEITDTQYNYPQTLYHDLSYSGARLPYLKLNIVVKNNYDDTIPIRTFYAIIPTQPNTGIMLTDLIENDIIT